METVTYITHVVKSFIKTNLNKFNPVKTCEHMLNLLFRIFLHYTIRTTFVHISREYILLRCFRKLCTVILFGKLPRKIFFFGYIKLNYICDVRFWQGIENEQKKLSSCEPIDYVEVIFDKYK